MAKVVKSKKEKKSKKSKTKTSSDRKKEKKEKKKSKLPKEKDSRHGDSDANAHEGEEVKAPRDGKSDGKRNNKAVPINVNVSISIAPPSGSTSGGWSWGSAFAAASEVKPDEDDLDDNFLKAAAASDGVGKVKEGVVNISQLANDHKKTNNQDSVNNNHADDSSERKAKRKRSKSGIGSNNDDDDDDDDSAHSLNSDDLSLEGRMATISSDNGEGEMSLVLVDKKSGKVFSSGERTQGGSRLVIGKIVKGNVELDPLGVLEMKRLEQGDTSSSQDTSTTGPSFPYETDPDDHCETPLQSYKDIIPILNELCKDFGGDKQSMNIYDPYFCDGSVVKHLSSLGFGSVYNKKQDCYSVWKSKSEPKFDVFLTNPPYSEDHIEKLMNYVTSSSFGSKPWLLLMPQWVHKKDYYVAATTKNRAKSCNPFYIVPKKRYVYLPPTNFREKKDSDVHKKSSPFVSMWYCWGGNEKRNGDLMNAFRKSAAINDCDLARSKSALRDLRRNGGDKGSKKKKAKR